jgi:hypothetical protein
MSDNVKKSIHDILNEMSPADFNAGDEEAMKQAREDEELQVVEGGGTYDRKSARKMNARRMQQLIEMSQDPDRDNSSIIVFRNILNWFDAIYGDQNEYEGLLNAMQSILKYRGRK